MEVSRSKCKRLQPLLGYASFNASAPPPETCPHIGSMEGHMATPNAAAYWKSALCRRFPVFAVSRAEPRRKDLQSQNVSGCRKCLTRWIQMRY